MKVVAVLLALCVACSLGSILPKGPAATGTAAVGVGKLDAEKVEVGEKERDWGQDSKKDREWEVKDVKKARNGQTWAEVSGKSAHDANAKASDWSKDASKWDEQRDAANKASHKAAAENAAKDGHQAWSASDNFDQNQYWTGNQGWRKGKKNHEKVSFAFDKNFRRNANENGGYDAGSKLNDWALDDYGDKRSSYDRMVGDHSASARHRDGQSADRSGSHANAAWANRASADKFGRDADQAAGANGNDRDWAEKLSRANNVDTYDEDSGARAYDALRDNALLDRNANRKTVGYGAARNGGVAYGYGAPYAAGYAGKGLAAVGKDRSRANGGSDKSNVWDAAQRNKNQKWAGDEWTDRTKQSAVANNWQNDEISGWDKDQAASYHDKGYAADARSRDEGAKSRDDNWAAANAAKFAGQARHDLDEEAHLRANKKWKQSDRKHDVNEWKKFYNNDQKGGKNWERLKYNRDQTDDSAAADYNVAKDNSNTWRDGHRFDSRSNNAHGNEAARAAEAQNREWSQDWTSDANGADNQAATASDHANRGVWGNDNQARKYGVEQVYQDQNEKEAQVWDKGSQRAGYDDRAFGGNAAKGVGVGVAPVYGGYGYGNLGRNAGYGYANNFKTPDYNYRYAPADFGKGYGSYVKNYYY